MFVAMDRLVASMKNDRYNDTPKMNSTEAADRLMRLKMLYDAGALTKEEFEKKKSELIDFI